MKRIKSILLIAFLMIILTGCTETDLLMEIDKDGVVSISHSILIDNGSYNSIRNLIDNDKDNFIYNSYTVEKITENNKTGFKMYKTLGGINTLDNGNDTEIAINNYASPSFSDSKLFNSKNLFLVNKYVARYVIDLTDIDEATAELPIVSGVSFNIIPQNNSGVRYMSTNETDINSLNNQVPTTFTLKSEYRVGNNNATREENGKYIWDLKYGIKNEIMFEVYNTNNGTILSIIVLISIFIIVCLFLVFRKNRIRSFNKVSLRDSLELEEKIVKRGEYVDNKQKLKELKEGPDNADNATLINDRIRNAGVSLGTYSQSKTVEQIAKDLDGDNVKREVKSLNDIEDPKFRMITKESIQDIRNRTGSNMQDGQRRTKFINDLDDDNEETK